LSHARSARPLPSVAPPSPRTAAVHGTFHGVGCGLFEPVGRRMTETSEDDMGWKRVRLFMGWTPRVHRVPTAHGLSYLEFFFLLKRKKKTKKRGHNHALVFWDLSLVCLFKVLVLGRIIWIFPGAQHLRADDRNGAQHKTRLRENTELTITSKN